MKIKNKILLEIKKQEEERKEKCDKIWESLNFSDFLYLKNTENLNFKDLKYMENLEFYEKIKEKFKKYNSENEEKIGFEAHSQSDLRNEYLAYIYLDLYTELDYFELLEILLKMDIGNFVLKIFRKYPKKKRSFSLRILKNKL